jgi:outer membrane receptor protein involved in Fe transport
MAQQATPVVAPIQATLPIPIVQQIAPAIAPAKPAAPHQLAPPAQVVVPPSQAPAISIPASAQAQSSPTQKSQQPGYMPRPGIGSAPQPQFVNADALKARSTAQDKTVAGLMKSQNNGYAPMALQKMRNAYKQTLNGYFTQNHGKKLTQAQVDQLNKKMDEIDKAIAGLQNPH